MENWKDIPGYEGLYKVSDMGNVKNVKRNRNLKLYVNSNGYVQITLFKNNKRETLKVHRLVAEAFIDNPENKPTVDHINTIRTDNRVSNLRWFTQKEQLTENEISKERHIKFTSELGKRFVSKAVESNKKKVLCVTTGEIFNSAKDAARYYNIKDKNGVSNTANPNHVQKTCGELPDGTKLKWQYIN